uniref:1-phosphatidylinositol 4-kinase n=1 Tax=Rhodosorus marinus TaxID=101924 RepID=A0A7S0BNV7_9RHOD
MQEVEEPPETENEDGGGNEIEDNNSGIKPVDHSASQQRGHQRRSTGQFLLKVDTVGDGVGDVALQLGGIGEGEKEDLDKWLRLRKERSNFFHAELDFVKCLTDLSYHLFTVARPQRKAILRSELEKLNEYIPRHAFIPVLGFRHRVLRIVPEEAFVFSTKERSPFLLTFEVEKLPMENDLFPMPQTKQSLRRKIKETLPDDVGQVPNQPEETFKYEPDVSVRRADDLYPEDENDDNSDARTENDDGEHVNPQVIEAFGELFTEKENRLKLVSPHKEVAGWGLASCIIKSRDQLRQEMVAMRLISEFYQAFQAAKLKVWIKPYQILATSADSGFIETIKNAQSLSSLRSDPKFTNLRAFFRSNFGGEGSSRFKKAVSNFVRSMAGYSVVTYILAIKDRHNGNLMIDSDGHISHIDFGFLLSNSPGGNREFERAPFKLTQDMIDVMGGPKSSHFRRFRKYGRKAYAEACKHMNKILLEVDMMFSGNESMPCFVGGRKVVLDGIRERMMPNASTQERMQQFDTLIKQSSNNWTTYWYDRYQKCFTGVA